MDSKVVIRKPCAQDLEMMPRVPGGIFCTVCSEKIEDLTRLSDEELKKWIRDRSSEHKTHPCGIYNREQARIPFLQRLILPFRYAAISTASLFLAKESSAKTNSAPEWKAVTDAIAVPSDTQQKVITGKVVQGRRNSPLGGVNVYVMGSGDSTLATVVTNSDGTFTCMLPFTADTNYTITFSSRGYRTQVAYGYVPCDKELVMHLKKTDRKDRKIKRQRIYSKF
jgi:hypothetical protein